MCSAGLGGASISKCSRNRCFQIPLSRVTFPLESTFRAGLGPKGASQHLFPKAALVTGSQLHASGTAKGGKFRWFPLK